MSSRKDIKIKIEQERLRPIDADYQMFNNEKIKQKINWSPKISAEQMFLDLLNHWRDQISKGFIPLNR